MSDQKSDVVVLEIPAWFSRQKGTREKLHGMVDQILGKGSRKIVVRITDMRRFVSMDVGILIGVWRKVNEAGGTFAISSKNDLLYKMPLNSFGVGLIVFREDDEAIKYLDEH
jgi:hypothetical protein